MEADSMKIGSDVQWIEFNDKHSKAAIKEGWNLWTSINNEEDGELQVQRNDEQGLLADDGAAWKIVGNGKKPHHLKAMALLKRYNLIEYNRVIKEAQTP